MKEDVSCDLKDDPCNQFACKVQACLEKAGKSSSGYMNWEKTCAKQIAAVSRCCRENKGNDLARPTCAFEWKRSALVNEETK
jgi:hypothetical protein